MTSSVCSAEGRSLLVQGVLQISSQPLRLHLDASIFVLSLWRNSRDSRYLVGEHGKAVENEGEEDKT